MHDHGSAGMHKAPREGPCLHHNELAAAALESVVTAPPQMIASAVLYLLVPRQASEFARDGRQRLGHALVRSPPTLIDQRIKLRI